MVAPSGTTKPVTLFEIPILSHASIVTGSVAIDDDVEKATICGRSIVEKNSLRLTLDRNIMVTG